jgi:hypothetical protein
MGVTCVRVRYLAVLLALGLAALLAAGARAETVTIQVTSVLVSMKPIDTKPKGTSKGDRIVYRDTLVNAVPQFGKKKGAKVGSDQGTMTFTSAHSARFDGTARLPGGTVRIRGQVRAISNTVLQIRVVGGTGRYASARGTLTVGPGDKEALNVYKLTLPATIA